MTPLAFTWPAGVAFWLACVWALVAELPFMRRARASGISPLDNGSMRAVELANVGGITIAFAIALRVRATAMTTGAVAAYAVGIGSLIAGGLLRRHCFRMLGPSFTFDVRVAPEQPIVERGAYRWLRHPSYTAGLLMGGGIGLALGNWLSLATSLVPAAFAYAYRISVEERALVDGVGAAYVDYMKRTHRVVPFVL